MYSVLIKRHNGLGLIELMLALALSAVLLASLAQVLTDLRRAERMQHALSGMQESGRFALQVLGEEIRQAGYSGCSGRSAALSSALSGLPAHFTPGQGLQGWNADPTSEDPKNGVRSTTDGLAVTETAAGWSGAAGYDVGQLPQIMALPGSDLLRVWGANPLMIRGNELSESQILSIQTDTSGSYLEVGNMAVEPYDLLLAHDCEGAEVVQSCSVSENIATDTLVIGLSSGDASCLAASGAGTGIPVGGRVVLLSGNLWYVGRQGNDTGQPPGLYVAALDQDGSLRPGVELIRHIANMQFLYGENTDSDPGMQADIYVTAEQVANWQQVVSIKVHLLVESEENYLVPVPRQYRFAGRLYLPSDRRLRREFSSTFQLRNRAP